MAIPRFIARQLALPSGTFGRYVTSRLLNRMNAAHNELVRQELAVDPGDRVLEVGFGGATLLSKLCGEVSAGCVAGVEVSAEMIALAGKRLRDAVATGRLVLKRGSIDSLPFGDAQFDKACSVNTIYFWPDLGSGFSELRRVLRPGGRLVIGFASSDDIVRMGLHRRGFAVHSADELKVALTAACFRVTHLRSGSDIRGTFYALTAERAA